MRKVIVIAIGVLFFLFIVLFVISRVKTSQQSNQTGPTPTTFFIDNQSAKINSQQNQRIINNALPLTPYENENFRFDYSTSLNQLVVQEKTLQAKEKFSEWAMQNGLTELADNPELVVFQGQSPISDNFTTPTSAEANQSPTTNNESQTTNNNQSPTPTSADNNQQIYSYPFINEFLNIFSKLRQNIGQVTPTPTSSLGSPSPSSITNPPAGGHPPTSGYMYYAQCNGYGGISLPSGCTLCNAGCGPTTVAMIASSFVSADYDPKIIVDMYQSRGYGLGCAGSGYYDAHSLLESLSVKTTDYLIFNLESADQVVSDLKNYLAAGWTFFTLANFRENGGGHFFWITDIDEAGNVWAYDPYYGRFQAPPLNENSRYPFPKYRVAFGVKK
ncbi:hypothetical protein COV86_00230 [Candidatus Roizmanbacteria bacterium CG11_big_fil_rev_8_21_14_0_20_35_14]|uniref:Peptidase C39-like domain-containing protein n=1 Tax=Candidatus Roizmanbacteria bacterium CG11_big_fil_rev_8_21_14_0_20_35_14 TaxID=1974855 RepID=A0A2H0KNT8_9BACT|nr:MAG: hypothetical protein COV86_00230 [Candidatus Roizmanbacteria bacterium CG11_big_fil_rev_8_21_14_0_20_35_14]